MLQARGHQQYEMEAPLPVELIPSTSIGSKTAHRVAIGDPVRSLRTLLKKFTRAHNGAWNPSTHSTVDHYLLPRVEVNDTISDYITFISPLFAFWRGGMRIYANNYGIAEAGLFLGTSHQPAILMLRSDLLIQISMKASRIFSLEFLSLQSLKFLTIIPHAA